MTNRMSRSGHLLRYDIYKRKQAHYLANWRKEALRNSWINFTNNLI
jgi:hypothetical protein